MPRSLLIRLPAIALALLAISLLIQGACSRKPDPPAPQPGTNAASQDAPAAPDKPAAAELPWQPYTRAALNEHRAAGRTVLVDFTADW
jgi:thiol:disulfide interchange protein